jgi:mannose-6-phosphate isomerase-like protein (cupin superfamily)
MVSRKRTDPDRSSQEATAVNPILSSSGAARRLDIFGVQFTVIVTGAETGGKLSLFEEITPPRLGPPLHIHHAEDEFFRILKGRYRFRLGEETIDAGAGDALVVPRGVPHTFLNVGDDAGHLFMGFTPGGNEAFFSRVAEEGLQVPDDMARIGALGAEHSLEFLGPNPLLADS